MNVKALEAFVEYCNKYITGDEKGEAQTFLDHFFMALGYKDGYKEAGATLEQRVKGKDTVSFADLFWPKKVLIEMKKSEEDLDKHLQQVQTYWLKLAGTRPRYVILCNFLEFWIYDFEKDIYEPADKIPLDQLPKRGQAFSFLLPIPATPVFKNNREAVTEGAAYMLAAIFSSLLKRDIDRDVAVHYLMQCILSMFAQNVNLLPDSIFTRIISECLDKKGDDHRDLSPESYDLVGALFREMNTKGITAGGRFKDVDYFNGGLFQEINPIELNFREIEFLESASNKDWSKVNPAIEVGT